MIKIHFLSPNQYSLIEISEKKKKKNCLDIGSQKNQLTTSFFCEPNNLLVWYGTWINDHEQRLDVIKKIWEKCNKYNSRGD